MGGELSKMRRKGHVRGGMSKWAEANDLIK